MRLSDLFKFREGDDPEAVKPFLDHLEDLRWVLIKMGIALAVAMAAIYGQVTVNDLVIARYTADAWRVRVYAVRYFLTFVVSGAAVAIIALLYARGGFGLVLGSTAAIAFIFVIATAVIALLVNGVEKGRVRAVAPAE